MTTPGPELSEKDFIQEKYDKNPFPFWLWIILLTALLAILWGGSQWYYGRIGSIFQESPFLQVTNREMSLFLWQNPEFMRVNAKQKNGYLTGFQYIDRVTMELASADQYSVAPPDLLFRYHTWSRLVGKEFSPTPIDRKEFREFLDQVPEWQPTYWLNAPQEYVKFFKELPMSRISDLSTLPESTLPLQVRMAFQGWKNYFKEGEAVNTVKPTYAEMRQFLQYHPHYARNYWRNIVEKSNPNYLKKLDSADAKDVVPANEMSSFLKVAIFNWLRSNDKAIGSDRSVLPNG